MKTEQFNQFATINSIFTLCKVLDDCICDLHSNVPKRIAHTVETLQIAAQSYCTEATKYVNENKRLYHEKDGIEIERALIHHLQCINALKVLSYALMVCIDGLHEIEIIPEEIEKPVRLMSLVSTRFQDALNEYTDKIIGVSIDKEELKQ